MARSSLRIGSAVSPLLAILVLASCNDQPTSAIRPSGDVLHDVVTTSTETGHVYICKNGVPGASYDFTYTAASTPPTSGSTTVVVPGCSLIWDVAAQGAADLAITEVPKSGSDLLEVDIADGLAGVALQQYFAPPGGSLTGTAFTVSATAGLQLLAVFNNATTCPATLVSSNFNGTPIAAGNYVWLNAVLKPSGITSAGGTVLVRNGAVTFTASGVKYVVSIPPSVISFSPTATMATTIFDGVRWITTVPWNYTGNIFIAGAAYPVPGGLPGGINPVIWSASLTTDVVGLKVNWKWGAAVYTSASSNPNALGVKPVDDNSLSQYLNSDHAGTPEFLKSYVIGGARGGGGSNFTGSYSGTASTIPCVGK